MSGFHKAIENARKSIVAVENDFISKRNTISATIDLCAEFPTANNELKDALIAFRNKRDRDIGTIRDTFFHLVINNEWLTSKNEIELLDFPAVLRPGIDDLFSQVNKWKLEKKRVDKQYSDEQSTIKANILRLQVCCVCPLVHGLRCHIRRTRSNRFHTGKRW